MSKAEDRANEIYRGDTPITRLRRKDYCDGYHQAEKDLALTLVDIKKICLIAREVHKYYGFWSDIVYQEVLNRFKEIKK